MTKITVTKRGGIEEIHKPGCADLKKIRRGGWGTSDRENWTLEVDTLQDLYASYWDCIADEAVAGGQYASLEECWWAWRSEFRLMPCAGNIPEMDEPGTASTTSQPNPEADRLAAAHNRTAYRIAELQAKIEWLQKKERTQYAAAMAALHDGQQMHHGQEPEYGASSISVVY